MKSFILVNLEEILAEWESFAKTVSPAAVTMDSLALRDHARQMLEAIAKDIETWQSKEEQHLKSQGLGPAFNGVETAAAAHGVLRHTSGFALSQLVAEFRALRATVLRLWLTKSSLGDAATANEIARFNEGIDQALAESVDSYSRELSNSRDTFLAILGHDLRSPLSAMAGAMHVLSQPATDAIRAEAMASGTRSVSTMSGMIRDLLEFTRTRLGAGIPIAPAPANLGTVCKAAVADVSLVYPQTAFRFESGGSLEGNFDAARIEQVVTNLLNNAVQHSRRGLPVLLIARGDDSKALTLEVCNQGVPIDPEHLQVIFDPLVQIPTEGSDPRHRSTNLGLGLFIAREIVLAHGGTIEAKSSVEGGTTFTVVLPCAEHASLAAETAPSLKRSRAIA